MLELTNRAAYLLRQYKGCRRGQAYSNAFGDLYPEYAEDLIWSGCDPFYDDSKLDDFFTWVTKKLCT